MVRWERGCHLLVQSAVAECRESLITQCVAHAMVRIAHPPPPHTHTHTHVVGGAFQGGYSAMIIAKRRVSRGQGSVMSPSKTVYRDTDERH